MDLHVVLLDECVYDLESSKEAPPEKLFKALLFVLLIAARQFEIVVAWVG